MSWLDDQEPEKARVSPLDDRESVEIPLARFLSVKDSYAGSIVDFQRFLERSHMALNLKAVGAYFAYLGASTLSAGTRQLRRQAVKARLRAVMSSTDLNRQARLEMMLRSLDHNLETKAPGAVRAGIPVDRIVGPEDFQLLVTGTSRRTSLFLWFLYNTGCRVAEMCCARLDKSEELGDMIRLTVTGKGNKERKVDVEKPLFDAIRSTFRGETYLFQTRGGKPFRTTYVSYEIIKAGRRILHRRISAHTMRHSFATLAIRDGASIKAVSEYLGHSSTAITMDMYVHESMQKRQKVRKSYDGP